MKNKTLSVAVALVYVAATLALAVLVMCGLALTWLYPKKGWPEETSAINCWAFAIPKWLRAGTTTNYLVVRRSKYNFVPHVKFCPGPFEQYAEELKPEFPKKGLRGIIQSFFFKGTVVKGKSKS